MANQDELLFQKLNLLIEDNLGNPLFSIDSIVKDLGLSRSKIHRIVKEKTDLSISLYIRKKRLERAVFFLKNSELRISEIAYEVGIDSPQNFSKYFIEEFEISPTDFRKKNLKEEYEIKHPLPNSITLMRRRPFRLSPLGKFAFIFIGFGGILVLILNIIFYENNTTAVEAAVTTAQFENSIAILPFKASKKDEAFSTGIREEIQTSLTLLENLKVIATNSTNKFDNSERTPKQIGEELHANYLLEGQLINSENNATLALKLIKSNDAQLIWTKAYSINSKKALLLKSQIVRLIADELNQKINTRLSKRLEKLPTQNLDAYNEFLQGRTLMISRTKDKLEASIIKFNHAIALDSTFSEAYAYKSLAYYLMGNMGYIDMTLSDNLAEKSALNAIRIDNQNATSYAIMGNIYRDQYKWDQSKIAYEIALKYKPNDAQTLYWYSLLLRSIGKLNQSVIFSSKAQKLDPLYPVILAGHIVNCAYAGKDEMALKLIKEGELIFSDSFVYYMAVGYYHLNKENYVDALKAYTKVIELNPNMKYFKTLPYYCQSRLGNYLNAKSFMAKLGNEPLDYVSKSMLFAGMTQKDSSLLYLKKASDLGIIHTDIIVHPAYKILHQDSRFKSILVKFNLPTNLEN